MNKKEFSSELRIHCTEETSNLARIWSCWFLYYIKDIDVVMVSLMSLIPISKANSWAAEQSTVSRLELSWRKEDAHPKPRGGRAQGPLCSPESALSWFRVSSPGLLSAPAPALGTCPVPKAAPRDWQAQGTHRCHCPACTTHALSQGLFSLLLYYWHLRGLFCFLVLHFLFLFHLIAKAA